jgi:serine/threonine-protein kinase
MVGQPYEQFGPYRLTHLLGKGGMASVYRAVRSGPMGFAKEVAVKRIHESLAEDEGILKGLINEARIGGQLKHPNIVEVYEFNKVGESYYLAMEFVDGWTLDRVVKLLREHGERIPPRIVLLIARQVCEALDYAHKVEGLDGQEVRLVHRDLKPANIIISRHGTAKLMDFGIAKAATNLFKTTMADVTKGTPHYMSPEQVAGDPNLTATSDLFALGSVIYELATLKVLFHGDSLATVLFSVVKADVARQMEELDRAVPGLGPLVQRLLQKNPAARYRDAAEVAAALGAVLDAHRDGPDLRSWLYEIRELALDGQPEPKKKPEDEPQFATLLANKRAEDAERKAGGLAEAKAAADLAIASPWFDAEESGVDTHADTSIVSSKDLPRFDAVMPPAEPARPKAAPPPPTRQAPPSTRKIARKKRPPIALVAAFGLAPATTIGLAVWALQGTGPPQAEVAVAATPVPFDFDGLVDATSAPSTPGDKRSPGPSTRPGSRARTSADPTPTMAPTGDPTPASADATAAPTPALPESTPAPTPALPEATPTPAVAERAASGFGKLSIKKSNPYSRVIVDGIDLGKHTPLVNFELPAGKHRVELEAVEVQSRSGVLVVEVRAGETLLLGNYDFTTKLWSP